MKTTPSGADALKTERASFTAWIRTHEDEHGAVDEASAWAGWTGRVALSAAQDAPAVPEISTEHGPWVESTLHEGETYCRRCLVRSVFAGQRACEPHIVSAPAAPAAQGEPSDPLQGAANWLLEAIGGCNISTLQSHLKIGFNRAERLMLTARAAQQKGASNAR